MSNEKVETWEEVFSDLNKKIKKANFCNPLVFFGIIAINTAIIAPLGLKLSDKGFSPLIFGLVFMAFVLMVIQINAFMNMVYSKFEKISTEESLIVEHKYKTDLKRKYNAVFVDETFDRYAKSHKITLNDGEKYTAEIYYKGDEIVVENLAKLVNIEDVMKDNKPESSDKKDFDVIDDLKNV